MKYFTGALRALILEIFMLLSLVTTGAVVEISCTHFFTSSPRILSQLIDSTILVVSFPIFDEVHAH